MNRTHLLYSAKNALVATILISMLGMFSFFAFEPSVGRSASGDSRNFTVTQQITNEISFLVDPGNVTMVGSIAGLTGGFATGTTLTSVRTNNATGYNMTLHFATNSRPHAMVASSTDASSAYISNYTQAGGVGVPDYNWADNASGASAEFGYSVNASTSAEVAQAFKNNGSACNQSGGTATLDHCWLNPTTTPQVIVNSSLPSSSSTTTIKFKVAVPSAPSPALPSGFYTATGTLTIFTN
jgi:hypothetical protein